AADEGCDHVLAVLDARRGEAFAAAWTLARDPSCVLPAAALAPATLAERIAELNGRPLAVGNGALAFRSVLEAAGATVPADASPVHAVRAAIHAELGAEQNPGDPRLVEPDYIRIPDAEINLRAAQAR